MCDLETMGTGTRAAVTAIALVLFDENQLYQSGNLYAVVDLESSTRAGLRMDASTVKFWMEQPDEARLALLRTAEPLPTVLQRFKEWWLWSGAEELWGNGSDFDNVILREAFKLCRIEPPWKFWQNRCFRTLKNVMAAPPAMDEWRRGYPKHHALGDAYVQAEQAQRMLLILSSGS